jgi:Flp pilus assembly protein CpaB
MRRGRIFIFLALIIIIGVAGAYFYLRMRQGANPSASAATATPASRFVQVISAAQPIAPGTLITQEMLGSYPMPEENLVEGLIINPDDVLNMYAKMSIPQGAPITASAITAIPGSVNLPGSSWSTYIPQGLTAVSIPISRLSAAAFGVRDGDYVDVIVTMLLVDVDPAKQSSFPNNIAGLEMNEGVLTITEQKVTEGQFAIDEVANALMYIQPSEDQRPRMVTQMIMQKIQVLHVGTFPLPGEANSDLLTAQPVTAPTPTPNPSQPPQSQVIPSVVRPDMITLMVTPQDAVTLTYLIYSGAQINLTLRNPNDQDSVAQPDAAMLEYLLTQYNIPVPAKLPYSLAPRLDVLRQPQMPNDPTPVP